MMLNGCDSWVFVTSGSNSMESLPQKEEMCSGKMVASEQEASSMSEAEQLKRLIKSAQKLGLLNGGREYRNFCRAMFETIDFRGKNVLEIGCGKGMMCLWAKIHGANRVVGLEPLAEGCYDSTACYKDFLTIVSEVGLEDIEVLPTRLEEYRPSAVKFDIVLSFASINHLDEKSCIDLRRSATAHSRYVDLFSHVRQLMPEYGTLLIADASNRSFYSDLHLRNPFNPHIEWFKHQPPECWAQLLSECGFTNPRISWLFGPLFAHLGIGTVPRAMSYFHASAFRLEMDCAERLGSALTRSGSQPIAAQSGRSATAEH